MKRSKGASRPKPGHTDRTTVKFELKVGDETLHVSLKLPTTRTSPRRMLPVFQSVAHKLIDAGVAEATARGESVSCKAGCGACCRQSVPISLTEARHLAGLVDAMPEPRRSDVRARFADALTRLEAAGLLGELRKLDEMPAEWHAGLNARYLPLRIACPFLEDESCSIHPDRPVICREYLVTSSPEHCVDASPETVRRIPIAAHVSTDVVLLEYRGPAASRVPLVLALEWAEKHAHDEPAPRPPVEWLEHVFESHPGRAPAEP
ncbi:MAG TPA: YkgJ family cysteine cluster protein [Polyangiaceae bacterium]|jgi:Fe-S-cluster containining protein